MPFEIEFLPVGSGTKSGDAICMRYSNRIGAFEIHIVDGGYTETGADIVEHIKKNYGYPAEINNIVLSHPDSDHVSGLFEVLEKFKVENLWMHRPWLHVPEIIHNFHGNWTQEGLTLYIKEKFKTLVELEELALSRGANVRSPFQGEVIGSFTVLAPSRQRYLKILVELPSTPAEVKSRKNSFLTEMAKISEAVKASLIKLIKESWYSETLEENPEATSPSNESSVVQASLLDGKKILLTADVGPDGLKEAFEYAEQYSFSQPDLIQVPHHGSRRNVTPSTLNKWLGLPVSPLDGNRGIAVCSAAKEDLDHPRAKVENAFTRRGYDFFSTKGSLLYFGKGMTDRGYTAAKPAPFREEVEE